MELVDITCNALKYCNSIVSERALCHIANYVKIFSFHGSDGPDTYPFVAGSDGTL